jgi:excisionase family DNA binding protein
VTDRLLTAAEVAELLSVSKSWVEERAREGDIPHVRLGRYRRYQREEVLAWLSEQRAGRWRWHEPKAPA